MTAADWTLAVLGGLVLYAALVLGFARFCGTNSRTEQPAPADPLLPETGDYPTVEFPAIPPLPEPPRTMLGRDDLLWGLTVGDEHGDVTLALHPTGDGRLAVLVDVEGRATGVWMGRAEVQDYRHAITSWLCTTSRQVAS